MHRIFHDWAKCLGNPRPPCSPCRAHVWTGVPVQVGTGMMVCLAVDHGDGMRGHSEAPREQRRVRPAPGPPLVGEHSLLGCSGSGLSDSALPPMSTCRTGLPWLPLNASSQVRCSLLWQHYLPTPSLNSTAARERSSQVTDSAAPHAPGKLSQDESTALTSILEALGSGPWPL